MRILIAEDDSVSRLLLKTILSARGYEVVSTCQGQEALEELRRDGSPPLAILDWLMPVMDGLEVCRQLRAAEKTKGRYVILLTGKDEKEDVVAGLRAGANDYVTKPFEHEELLARVQVGERVIQLQAELTQRVSELEEALIQVKQLRGLLPICAYCKKIRDDQNYWQELETYFNRHSAVQFSHGICPDCRDKVLREFQGFQTQPNH